MFRMGGLVGVGPVRYVNGGFLKKLQAIILSRDSKIVVEWGRTYITR